MIYVGVRKSFTDKWKKQNKTKQKPEKVHLEFVILFFPLFLQARKKGSIDNAW